MNNINIVELEKGFRGKPFNKLIEAHINKQNEVGLYNVSCGLKTHLPLQVQSSIEGFIDVWNESVYSKEFWITDTAEIFISIVNSATEVLKNSWVEDVDDEMLFSMFQIVVLNYAYTAVNQTEMQKFLGIKKKKKLFGIFNI